MIVRLRFATPMSSAKQIVHDHVEDTRARLQETVGHGHRRVDAVVTYDKATQAYRVTYTLFGLEVE